MHPPVALKPIINDQLLEAPVAQAQRLAVVPNL